MYRLATKVMTFLDGKKELQRCHFSEVKKGKGYSVATYPDMVQAVASLSFSNPEYVLFFRGQGRDYKNAQHETTLHTSIFRSTSRNLSYQIRENRFRRLERAEQLLTERYNLEGRRKIRIFQILRWSLLQHYEVCLTPLLDLSHSLRVACSFAFQDHKGTEAFVYIFGLPQISGSVTASSENGIQTIRLLSICPPSALRPHFQEGYLVGEYPTISLQSKEEYDRGELDFNRRLICKFRIPLEASFWPRGFSRIPQKALYPNERDPVRKLFAHIRSDLDKAIPELPQ